MNHPKQQFNVYLAPSLIARIKHRAIDEQQSLSDLVAKTLTEYLEKTSMNTADTQNKAAAASPAPLPMLKLQPMVHVQDMAASIRFYEALGATLLIGSRDGDWAQLRLGGAEIGLLAHPANPEQQAGEVELNFEYDASLAELEEKLRAAGINIARPAADEAFGEQLQVEAPGGMLVKINKLDPTTFR